MEAVEGKLKEGGLNEAARKAFLHNYAKLEGGDTGLIPEEEIEAVDTLPRFEEIQTEGGENLEELKELLSKTVVLKLNGGLGTSMGLEKAKSLLAVKDGRTFLDLIADQIKHLSENNEASVQFVLMNSFSTNEDTLEALGASRPEILSQEDLILLQNKSPKIDAATMKPVVHEGNRDLEWCPPGHGDIYPSLLGSGMLDRLIERGFRYAFVSNSDNLGAVMSTDLLSHFAKSGAAFMMEVAERTEADKKGGHLARRKADRQLILRESAMCPDQDKAKFQDVSLHKYFNTNNLWLDFVQLKKKMEECDGVLPLPLIKNKKTVNPRDATSTSVYQLETAMGSAIECFPNASAVVVPRSRFSPVKTCSDLFALRSDAYHLTDDFCVKLNRDSVPVVKLDDKHYKHVDKMEKLCPDGIPSLISCSKLQVSGPVVFKPGTTFKGACSVTNEGGEPKELAAGVYENQDIKI
ncbi:UDP-glucose pyrophosphorylase [Chloropicon primus]|uniref:UTP--glucose-1-phosphate uridylyltransferase n=1 Tax=Chloropicon primus TaxID=1764295 RepID=A0A5B8MKS3_9CHLO|nr:UDP-glucose pyrophosphorylase [Chloropicon primus]UPR00264.1 UDP-glucose pyrophosphorylase [Chloropicon primus]|mmetsp:Transcript_2016/g.5494  ORF Transcript_2016/g.5494 Transcript_2016/m.5494 type:complete len:465 (-) Transcript_2016:74-1468(-)|eukprot:QDZ21053.1 UDP-glucose pyrophosphorylase [Chloropicon primus]